MRLYFNKLDIILKPTNLNLRGYPFKNINANENCKECILKQYEIIYYCCIRVSARTDINNIGI